MDEQFEQYTDTFFSERHSNILIKLRKENYQHSILMKEITVSKEELKCTISEKTWHSIENLLRLLSLQNQTEGKHLYVQGMKDCIDILHFLEKKYISNDYDELQLFLKDNVSLRNQKE